MGIPSVLWMEKPFILWRKTINSVWGYHQYCGWKNPSVLWRRFSIVEGNHRYFGNYLHSAYGFPTQCWIPFTVLMLSNLRTEYPWKFCSQYRWYTSTVPKIFYSSEWHYSSDLMASPHSTEQPKQFWKPLTILYRHCPWGMITNSQRIVS